MPDPYKVTRIGLNRIKLDWMQNVAKIQYDALEVSRLRWSRRVKWQYSIAPVTQCSGTVRPPAIIGKLSQQQG